MYPYACDHARLRMQSRYGFEPTRMQWRTAFLDVTGFRTLLACKENNGREIHYMLIGDTPVKVVYCPVAAQFITVLPLHPSKPPRRTKPFDRPRRLVDDPYSSDHLP